MKTLLIFFILLGCIFSSNTFSQKLDSAALAGLSPESRKEADVYLKRARNSKIAGTCLLAGGGLLVGISVILWGNQSNDTYSGNFSSDLAQNMEPDGTTTLVGVLGLASILGSIPCFVNVHKNREKVRAMIYTGKPVTLAPNLVMPKTSSYGITIEIPLGK
jgi:hypothetical protein